MGIENREVREGSCDRPRNLQIRSILDRQSFPSNDLSVQGGGSESNLYHLPPPDKSSSATSSPVLFRRLSAASVASRASQNRLSGGSFKGSKSKLRIIEREKFATEKNVSDDQGNFTCGSSELPEVEIVSLLEEPIPKYKLRADYLTEQGSYPNKDFTESFTIQTPTLSDEQEEKIKRGLTPEQAEAALEYFVLAGDRLSQMTQTYNDVDAVTRLLQEKETDLELAAKIGQELLDRNRRLDDKICGLESSLQQSNDLITQLKHELNLKTDLLHAYTDNEIEAAEESEEDDIAVVGLETSSSGLAIKSKDGSKGRRRKLTAANVELIERKVKHLKEDNKKLQEEATELAKEAFACEQKEEKLVSETVKHLTESNLKFVNMSNEYQLKIEECLRQKEEITHL